MTLVQALTARIENLKEHLELLRTQVEELDTEIPMTKHKMAAFNLEMAQLKLKANAYDDAIYLFSRACICLGEFQESARNIRAGGTTTEEHP